MIDDRANSIRDYAFLHHRFKRGISLVELVVVLGVLGVLVSLVLVGVLSVRESARRLYCAAHLRQIGIAVASYEGVYRKLPAGRDSKGFSAHSRLLPYLELMNIYSTIRFDRGAVSSPNLAVTKTPIPVFKCPSSPHERPRSDFVINRGVLLNADGPTDGSMVFIYKASGTSSSDTYISTTDLARGSSVTSSFSEYSVGAESPLTNAKLHRYIRLPSTVISESTRSAFVRACVSSTDYAKQILFAPGTRWIAGGSAYYRQILEPNGNTCLNGNTFPDAIFTASSLHTGGVNVLYCDGHEEFVSSSIDRTVWQRSGVRTRELTWSP